MSLLGPNPEMRYSCEAEPTCLPAHPSQPILEVVIVGDAGNLAVADNKKRARIEAVGLSVGRGQPSSVERGIRPIP